MSLPTTSPEESGALRCGQRSVSTATVPSSPRKITSGSLQIVRASGFAPSSVEVAAVYHCLRRNGVMRALPRRPRALHTPPAAPAGERSLPLHRHHAAFLDCEREPSLLERERLVTEQLAPPSGERRHIGLVVGGDAVEV